MGDVKLPCKDCICLAVCRSYYLDPKSETTDLDPIVSIACRCKLLRAYIFDSPTTSHVMTKNENTFVAYMKGYNNNEKTITM